MPSCYFYGSFWYILKRESVLSQLLQESKKNEINVSRESVLAFIDLKISFTSMSLKEMWKWITKQALVLQRTNVERMPKLHFSAVWPSIFTSGILFLGDYANIMSNHNYRAGDLALFKMAIRSLDLNTTFWRLVIHCGILFISVYLFSRSKVFGAWFVNINLKAHQRS